MRLLFACLVDNNGLPRQRTSSQLERTRRNMRDKTPPRFGILPTNSNHYIMPNNNSKLEKFYQKSKDIFLNRLSN
ncbi:MAG: hypothetical protein LBP59_10330 [Planctomycetaceae bacterium]|nr:hypothetical protein [Planctomycetaceae bacterium]